MSRITTCPHCSTRLSLSERITDKTLICPHCLADVDNPWPRSQIRAADINTYVKRDLSAVSIVLAVLMGLCVLGIVVTILAPRSGGRHDFGPLIQLAYFFAALDAVVCIAILRGLLRWATSGVQSPSLARVVGIAFLWIGTIVAVIIFFFFTCIFLCEHSNL